MRKTKAEGQNAVDDVIDICARLKLHELIDGIFEGPLRGLGNYAAELETLLRIIGPNSGLSREIACLRSIKESATRLCDLQDEANTGYENTMSQPAIKGSSVSGPASGTE